MCIRDSFVDVLHEAADAALVAHALPLDLVAPLVGEGDAHAGVEEALLPQAGEQGVVVVDGGLGEHHRVRLEAHGGAAGGGGAQMCIRDSP